MTISNTSTSDFNFPRVLVFSLIGSFVFALILLAYQYVSLGTLVISYNSLDFMMLFGLAFITLFMIFVLTANNEFITINKDKLELRFVSKLFSREKNRIFTLKPDKAIVFKRHPFIKYRGQSYYWAIHFDETYNIDSAISLDKWSGDGILQLICELKKVINQELVKIEIE